MKKSISYETKQLHIELKIFFFLYMYRILEKRI